MQSNPYAPPAATVDDAPQTGTEPAFFPVSGLKLVVMNLSTLGLYTIYWFYQNWKRIRAYENSNIKPVWRAVFCIFYCYACFKRIRAYGEERDIAGAPAAGALATGWILCELLGRLPVPLALLAYASVFFLLPLQIYANKINAAEWPEHERNARFSGWNWVAVAFAITLGVLAVAGLMFTRSQGIGEY